MSITNVDVDLEELYRLTVEAYSILREHVHETPIIRSHTLDTLVGKKVFLKLENMQKTGAFKVRGALYKIYTLISRERIRGVVTASSGNHAQGVAYAASRFGIDAVIVMPRTASVTKINATKSYGAKVILYGDYYDEAYQKAMEIVKETAYPFIHPYDDPHVIAGQGTIAHEILDKIPEPAYVIAPIGGGGLISGIATVVKRRFPRAKVIGVEPRNAPSMYMRIKYGVPETEVRPSIADAVVVKRPGNLTSKIVEKLVDDIVLVDEEEISHAIALLLERAKIVVEGAGALPVAALISGKLVIDREPAVAIISGGNIDPALLSRIIVHEMARDKRLVTIVGEVYDRPGELKSILEVLAKHGINIIDVRHDRWHPRLLPIKAYVEIVFEAKSSDDVESALTELRSRGYFFTLKE